MAEGIQARKWHRSLRLAVVILGVMLSACATGSLATAPPTLPAATLTVVASATPEPTTPPNHAMIPALPTAASVPTAIPTVPMPTATPPLTATAQATKLPHVFPVRSQGKITYGRYHHDYPAADIFCPAGSEFVAVTDGTVDFVSREDVWDARVNNGATRGGLSVAIIGDDGVRYYGSHLSAVADGIEPGVRVVAGQLLGRTGNSGDAATTAPHVHFGISHPTTPDDWAIRRGEIAPYPFLRLWQRGENAPPVLTQ